MLGRIAGFEFRYQLKSPLFAAVALLFSTAAFTDMALHKIVSNGGANVLYNSPHALIVAHLLASLVFLFVGAAFVANVIVRDDQTGFGAIMRTAPIARGDYLFGRFIGAFAVGALLMAVATSGSWLGTLMPFADRSMIGPNRVAGYAYALGLFALPNALIVSATLFAFATATRSTAGTFLGVIGLFVLYLVSQGLMAGQPRLDTVRVLADPFGMAAYLAAARYLTAEQFNAGLVPVTGLLLWGRLLWVGISVALLALTWRLFRFAERRPSRRSLRKRRRRAAEEAAPHVVARFARLPDPAFGRRAAYAQFAARAGAEARFVFKSPLFLILLAIAFGLTLVGLLAGEGPFGMRLHPRTATLIPTIQANFQLVLVIIATYYGGELVWRERERRLNEIIDATPLPAWALMLPKLVGLAAVLLATLAAGMAAGLLVQAVHGGVAVELDRYLLWYLLPAGADAALVAVLAIVVQALSPSKYAGWGMMLLYLVALYVGPGLGFEHHLFLYGSVPEVPLSDLNGLGIYWQAAWWFRLFWGAAALLMLAVAQRVWPRGTDAGLKTRLRAAFTRPGRRSGLAAAAAAALLLSSGGWILYNTAILNDYRTAASEERFLAEYERRFLRHARLPQPTIRHVALDVALYPQEIRAEVSGRYRIVNETSAPIGELHVRLASRDLAFVGIDLPDARLVLNDAAFGYRIYRLARPMLPGEARIIGFRTRREQRGFRAAGADRRLVPNGTDLDGGALAPRIGMAATNLIEDPALRRKYGLPAEVNRLPRLEDRAATMAAPDYLAWTTADITVSTAADQIAIAPGKLVAQQVRGGRRTARFVSDAPIRNVFSIQSGRYAVRAHDHRGVALAVYYHPEHDWNVDRVLAAMRAALDYYGAAFGPYQFDQARIVETPSYRSGAQAFANTIPFSEIFMTSDLTDPAASDLASFATAHELAHQWWGHQAVGTRMQGTAMLVETLAQYSALMVMKRLHGEDVVHRYLAFQRDRYLSGRRTDLAPEQPLARVEIGQDHIAYGKGAIAMYLLQRRIGEDAVNRALARFVARYRYSKPPYPRSTDLIALFRDEAKTAGQQALITDLFDRITFYDFRVASPRATRRADGRWDVAIPLEARKLYADGKGGERAARFAETIELGLWRAADDADPARVEQLPIRSGRQVLRLVTDERPARVGIDPYDLHIDRERSDNAAAVP